MGAMICLSHGGLHAQSASSRVSKQTNFYVLSATSLMPLAPQAVLFGRWKVGGVVVRG